MRSWGISVVSGWLLASLFLVGCVFESGSGEQRRIERDADRLAEVLTSQGFEVVRGLALLYREEDGDYSFKVIGSCLLCQQSGSRNAMPAGQAAT
jgi:hypothetical protein